MFCVVGSQEPGNGEEGGLQNRADFAVETNFLAYAHGVNHIKPDTVCGQTGFKIVGKEGLQFLLYEIRNTFRFPAGSILVFQALRGFPRQHFGKVVVQQENASIL